MFEEVICACKFFLFQVNFTYCNVEPGSVENSVFEMNNYQVAKNKMISQ